MAPSVRERSERSAEVSVRKEFAAVRKLMRRLGTGPVLVLVNLLWFMPRPRMDITLERLDCRRLPELEWEKLFHEVRRSFRTMSNVLITPIRTPV